MTELPLMNSRGVKTTVAFDDNGKFHVRYRQNVEPILERNKAHAAEYGKGPRGKTMAPIASIPIVVQYQWLKRYGITNVFDPQYADLIKRLLNDPEWRYLRTSELVF